MRRLIAVLLLALVACSPASERGAISDQASSRRVVATPLPTPKVTVAPSTPEPTPTPPPPTQAPVDGGEDAEVLPLPVPTAAPVAAPAPPAPSLAAFDGLGSWIDVFDHNDDPNTILPLVRGMADQGARTLYLETARFTSETDIEYPTAVGAALDEAKAKGMRVVAWYPPAFDDLERDVRRSLVAVNFVSPGGNRFDAFGADIEYPDGVADPAERSARAVEYSRQLRAGAGTFPLAAIVLPPTSLEINPGRWPGYPWKEFGETYDVVMPMSYWTSRGKDPATADSITRRNAAESARLTGRPVHVIGGLGADADEAQVAAYVRAAKEAGSRGGGLYDYATTRGEVWDELRGLNG